MSEAIIASIEAPIPLNLRERAADFALATIARQYLEILLPRQISTPAERPS
jgi:hypothetical protein